MNRRVAFLVAGLIGFLGIALGAFGAHALKDQLLAHHMLEVWSTAVLYHLIHAPVLLWLAGRKRISALAVSLFVGGILLFSGSLYALALTDKHLLGAITPLGGVLFMAGWLWIAIAAFRSEE
jgi:uncharacterized membrane protein YgdD (TMEM256/DUF423 family)